MTNTPRPSPSSIPPASTAPPESPSPTVSPTASPASAFPLTLTDDEGTSFTLETESRTVISLAPSFTEIVFALGAGDRLLGGTDFDDYPPEAVDLPDVATFSGVLIERVVDLDPDLVLAGGNNLTARADVARLRDLGFPVLVTYAPTFAEALGDIELIGQALGLQAEALAMTEAMRERADEVTAAVEDYEQPRVFYELGYQPEIYGPAPNFFVTDMIQLANGEPITTGDPAVFSISLEALIDADPEVIVLGDAAYDPGACPPSVAERPGWGEMTAVETGEIRPVDDIVVTRPGPRLADGLALLALAIHPDADITPPEGARELCTGP